MPGTSAHELTRDWLEQGLAHEAEQKWPAAEQLYRQVLEIEPENGDAWHLLGLLNHRRGRHQAAIPLLERALRAKPQTALFHSNLGTVCAAAGKFDRAAAAFAATLELDPAFPSADFNLGVALQQCGRLDEAMAWYQRAVQQHPDSDTFNNLGIALRDSGRLSESIAAFRKALALDPDFAPGWENLGYALERTHQPEQALECYQRRALLPDPSRPLLLALGRLLAQGNQLPAAADVYHRALAIQRDPELCHTLGSICNRLGRFSEAEALLREAARARPNSVGPHNNLGLCYLDQGRLSEAMDSFNQALVVRPDCVEARYNRSLVLLASGEWPQGWHEFAWRHHFAASNSPLPPYPQPRWQGQDVAGRTVLLYAEQGLGDSLQFVRYVPQLAARGASVLLVCTPKLHRLLSGMAGLTRLLAPGDPLPPFDLHAPLMDLPAAFGTTLETIPAEVPYLRGPGTAQALSAPRQADGLRVGFVWAGSPLHPKDRFRSVELEAFRPLLELEGIHFYSLQAGARVSDLAGLPASLDVADLGSGVQDLAETADAIAELDLVISVDTAVAHLAGALAKPVWLLLPCPAEWRWLLDRADSPWYPTMRLFRQPRPGDWASVFAEVKLLLSEIVALPSKQRLPSIYQTVMTAQPQHLPKVSQPAQAGLGRVPVTLEAQTTAAGLSRSTSNPEGKAENRAILFYAGQPGEGCGWGTCNRHLLAQLSRLTSVRPLRAGEAAFQDPGLPGDLFTPLQGVALKPFSPARGRRNFGYAFFENELMDESVVNAARFDTVFVGSSWCQERLREKGIHNGAVLLQGVDGSVFYPETHGAPDGRFLLFSGGKLELRKGQDLVLRTFSILSRQYPDLVLVTAWHNPWQESLQTLRASPHIRFELRGANWAEQMNHLYRVNDIDPARVITLGSLTTHQMARVYRMTDLGVFPNRCEGGTNLVLMEYMACGKPAVASFASGHRDILNDSNAFLLTALRDLYLSRKDGQLLARWQEPSVDEIVAQVTRAYQDRRAAQLVGERGAQEMKKWSWNRTALRLLEHIGLAPVCNPDDPR